MKSAYDSPGRLIAIGDVHGHANALSALLQTIDPTPSDTLVMLGDYVNRGPDSRGVLELLLAWQGRCQLIPILGNHEEMMLDSRNDRHALQRWAFQGGDKTLDSYGVAATVADIPQTHWDFLASCQPYFETERFVFAHANYCWYSALPDQPTDLLRWTSIDESPPRAHTNGKTFVLGHTPGAVRDYGFYRCLDTGCGFGGCLTAMEVNHRTLWQVGEDGRPVNNTPLQGPTPCNDANF